MIDGYEIMFRCTCGQHHTHIRWREIGEDLADYLKDAIMPGVAIAHRRASPGCRSEKCDLFLKMSHGAEAIGYPTKQ